MSDVLRVLERLLRAQPRNADILELHRLVSAGMGARVEQAPKAVVGCSECARRRRLRREAQARWRAKR
jgi:hypothetical protein